MGMNTNTASPPVPTAADQSTAPSGYQRTEVGLIPVDWAVKTLNALGSFMKGKGIKRDDVTDDGLACIRYGELYTRYNNYVHAPASRIPESVALTAQPLRTGDLLFAGSGETAEEIGKCVAYLGEEEAYAGGDIVILRPVDQNSLYLGHLLNHTVVAEQKARYGQGDAVVHISARNLAMVKLPLPPTTDEQNAIAEALSDVDGLIGALAKLIAKKRAIKQAAMQQLLTGKTRLPGFTGEWTHDSLGAAGKCYRGVSYEPDKDLSASDQDYTVRLFRSNNIRDAAIRLGDVQYVHRRRVASEQIMQTGDLLLCMANGSRELVGKAAHFHVDDGYEYTFGAFMGCFRTCPESADQRYIGYLMQSARFRDHIGIILSGSSINNLKPSDIEAATFPMPEIEEQQAIATVLSDMDREITALEQHRDKTQKIKQGMMQQLLTGRVRLAGEEATA